MIEYWDPKHDHLQAPLVKLLSIKMHFMRVPPMAKLSSPVRTLVLLVRYAHYVRSLRSLYLIVLVRCAHYIRSLRSLYLIILFTMLTLSDCSGSLQWYRQHTYTNTIHGKLEDLYVVMVLISNFHDIQCQYLDH